MPRRLALKRLTVSDLTFFTWHFRNNPDVRQKAINLNADIFISRIYPALPETELARLGKIPLDLFIYGPGLQGELNVQRKIVKTPSYKNWRLNGEMVDDVEHSDRFSSLVHGDFVVFEFTGDIYPISAKAVFISRALPEDAALHHELSETIGTGRMVTLEPDELTAIIERAGPDDNHPIHELILDEALEDAIRGGSQGTERLLQRRSGNRLTREQLLQKKAKVENIGRKGEEVVNLHLGRLEVEGDIDGFEWVSDKNAIAPYDFRIWLNDEEESPAILLDAKSTEGEFDRTIHISLSELRTMAIADERYDIYRVYEIGETTAKLRVAQDMRLFAAGILSVLKALPEGILADGISVKPDLLPFQDTIIIELDDEPEEDIFQLT